MIYSCKAKATNDSEYTLEMKRVLRCYMGEAVDQIIHWLDWKFLLAKASKFEEKIKELKSICEPIVKKMHENLDVDAAGVAASTSVPIFSGGL